MSKAKFFESLESRTMMSGTPDVLPHTTTHGGSVVVPLVPPITRLNSTLHSASTVSAQNLMADQMMITWGGDTGAEKGYMIQRITSGRNGWTTVGTRAQNVRSFVDSGLTAGKRYYYRIVAIGENGQFAYSDVFSGVTHH